MSRKKFTREDVLHVESKHVTYCAPRSGRGPDLHVVKQWITLKDGTRIPVLRPFKDRKRPYWVTKEGFRNHEQKKEWEEIDKLDRYECRQYEFIQHASNVLNLYRAPYSLRQLFENPFIYGGDISSTAILKHELLKEEERLEVPVRPATVAGLDTETDMVFGTQEILMAGISYRDKGFTAVVRSFVAEYPDPIAEIKRVAQLHIAELLKERNMDWEIILVDTPAQAVVETYKRLHEWRPDWVSVWNLRFDYEVMLAALEKEEIDPAQVFSDPGIPDEFKFFKWEKGPTVKREEDGSEQPIPPHKQWDVLLTPAAFQMVDGMQAFDKVRTGSAEQSSYRLSDICDAMDLAYNKLHFEEDAHLVPQSPEWHEFMQRKWKIRYIIYNLVDNILLELLDEKTKDLADTLNTFAQMSDLKDFRSQPRRRVDDLHFELLEEQGLVIGTTSKNLRTKLDDEIYPLTDWINKPSPIWG